MKYGKLLKNERISRKLTQKELAKAIGITQQAISFYENDINEPTIYIIVKIADFYEISIDELIGREIPKNYAKQINIHNEYKF